MPLFGLLKPDVEKLKAKKDVAGLYRVLISEDADESKKAAKALVSIGAPAVKPMLEAMRKHGYNVKKSGVPASVLIAIGKPAADELLSAMNDENANVHHIAAIAIGALGDRRAAEPFITALKEQSLFNKMFIKMAACKYLADLIGNEAQEPLLDFLRTEYCSEFEAEDIAGALGKVGDERSIEPLVQITRGKLAYISKYSSQPMEAKTKASAIEALGKVCGRCKDSPQRQAGIDRLVQLLKDDNPGIRAYSGLALGEIIDHQQAGPLLEAMKDGHPLVRSSAAYGLRATVDKRKVEPLLAALGDPDKSMRMNAAEALGIGGDARAVNPLVALLRDGEAGVRKSAATSLGFLNDARAVEPLIASLGDGDPDVRSGAALSLGLQHDTRAIPSLISCLKDSDVGVRLHTIIALGQLGGPEARKAIMAASESENEYVREAAARELARMKS